MNPALVVLIAAICMFLCESLWGPRQWPKVRWWWTRALIVNGFQAGSVFVFGLYIDQHIIAIPSLFSCRDLGDVTAILIAYLSITFIFYWWHRVRHTSNTLWLIFHQFHHSPQRLEVITSFYKHPIEIVMNSLFTSGICYYLLGLSPEQAASTTLITGLAELYYHWNMPTPYWTGYFFQRPESHCVHHQMNLHKYNFSDLPLWDMMFGTFRNPKQWDAQCGFEDDAELRIADLLRFKDVNQHLKTACAEDEPEPGIGHG